jgi:hypothetical protein
VSDMCGSGFLGLSAPEPPKPKPPPKVDPAEARLKAQKAADRRRKAAIGAYGFSDTNITKGALGAPGPGLGQKKTLIGG